MLTDRVNEAFKPEPYLIVTALNPSPKPITYACYTFWPDVMAAVQNDFWTFMYYITEGMKDQLLGYEADISTARWEVKIPLEPSPSH